MNNLKKAKELKEKFDRGFTEALKQIKLKLEELKKEILE